MKPAVVVLGASGRLGRPLVSLLSAAGIDTIAVTRSPCNRQSSAIGWITGELSDRGDQARVVTAVSERFGGSARVVVVDLVLDRSGVDGMRRSVQAATDTVLRLCDRLRECAAQPHLVAASSTAVLAPGLYQTPYGLAKRRQVVTYARAGLPGTALLLPVLRESAEYAGPRLWPGWSFAQAANQLHAAAEAAPGSAFVLKVPSLSGDSLVAADRRKGSPIPAALITHLRCLLTEPNSMQAHRSAARSRLGLSPTQLRRRVDHHLAPAELVRRFADRYHVAIVRDQALSTPDGGGTPHA
ncbi:NAD-dependent epimerase/dehydratase family protein [Micromonospora sp. NPDC005203]|uniref:NAD-dependent epimerase/dehydratase family protein n=1 Tax=Micromonospora sp. NPDC005203 TaxID=3364226 RepID=UPI0036AE5A70